METKRKEKKIKGIKILNKRSIFSILLRVLPNVHYDYSVFSSLSSNKELVRYFKSIRRMNEYPKLYDIFKRCGFDMSLSDQLRIERDTVKEGFYRSISKVIESYRSPFSPQRFRFLKEEQLLYIESFIEEIVPMGSEFVCPTELDLVNALNKRASSGLPHPYLKKLDFVSTCIATFRLFKSGTLNVSEVVKYPAAAFMRLQIRNSGLKYRVVNAVSVVHQFLESYYYLYFMSAIKRQKLSSSISIGLTQSEVSTLVSEFTEYNTYSIDYNGWDIYRPQILSVISFEIVRNFLALNSYEDRVFKYLRNIYLTLPLYHPDFEFLRRNRGTVSGSGFTSMDNSICNWILTKICLYEYCKIKGIDPYRYNHRIKVCGDDLLLGVKDNSFDFDLYSKVVLDKFGMIIRLEDTVAPIGVNSCFYLGSKWINGLPSRPERLMVASVIFGTGDFPYMSTNELLQSRFFEIFGNSSDTSKYWKRLKIPILNRRFVFNELVNPHRFSADKRSDFKIPGNRDKDRRGFWVNYNTELSDLDYIWSTR